MKDLVKHIGISAVSLFLVSLLFEGLVISGGILSYIIGGFLLTLGFKIIKPLFQVITFPIQLITFGLFSVAIIAGIMYAVTRTYGQIQINAFTFEGLSVLGFTIPSFYASNLLSFFIISATIYILIKVFEKVYID